MNVIGDKFLRNSNINRAMVVKPAVIGNQLMPPPQNAKRNYITPSSSRSRQKKGCTSSASHTKSTPTVHRDSHIIVSICEGRGKATGIVGIAAIDIYRPILILSQILDTQTYTSTLTKINILRPVEVLVPATFIDGATPSRIITVIMNQFPNLSVNAISRSEFNRQHGFNIIQTICAVNFKPVILQITGKFYSLAASCALLRYIEHSRKVLYSSKTIKVEYQEPEYTTAIDIDTADLLELVSNTNKQTSLFKILDYCATSSGRKLLRTNILQPPCYQNIIETRLDCIQELIENPNLLTNLQETLKPLSDIESALTFATVVPATASSVSERQLNYTLQLKRLLNAIQPLSDELKATKHPLFKDIYHRIEGLDTRKKILNLISEIIKEDAHLAKGQAGELQRCFAIKNGINDFLDLSRRLYTEGVDNMRTYVDELAAMYNLPLRVQHTMKNGFHIILPFTKALKHLKKTDLPAVFLKAEHYSSHYYLTTMDMMNFDKRLKNNSAEIQNISNVIIYKLLIDIRPYIGDLYDLCDQVAVLDMLVSLARVSTIPHWVRPRLVDTYINLENARHPLLEHVETKETIGNSIYAYPRCNLHLITGPNMSGKTILLHSICLIQILSQVGCYVPCTKATLRVCDRIYARVAQDDITLTASSFALEMTKLSYLLTTMSDKSLVVLDELCKTTACDEGVALAIAVCETFMKRGCFSFVASHFISLTILADMYPNVANWHLETLEENRANNTRISLKFTYRLLPGVSNIHSYGIKLSRIFNSSKSISNRAEQLYKYLLPHKKSLASESLSNNPEFLKFKLQSELDLLKIKNQLTDEIQNDKITHFQNTTGLKFDLSPFTIEHTNSNPGLDQSSSNEKKSSSNISSIKKKTVSSDSWMPTSSEKSGNSNHEFSIPNSIQENNKILEKSSSKHLFSIDDATFEVDSNLTFPYENSTQDISNEILSNRQNNLLFYNSTEDSSHDITFPCTNFFTGKSILQNEDNWSSIGNNFFNKTDTSSGTVLHTTNSNLQNNMVQINPEKFISPIKIVLNTANNSSGSILDSNSQKHSQISPINNIFNTTQNSTLTSTSILDAYSPVSNSSKQIFNSKNSQISPIKNILNTTQNSKQTSESILDSNSQKQIFKSKNSQISPINSLLNSTKNSTLTSESYSLVLNSPKQIFESKNSQISPIKSVINTTKNSKLASESILDSNSQKQIYKSKNSSEAILNLYSPVKSILNTTKSSKLILEPILNSSNDSKQSTSSFSPVLNSENSFFKTQNSLNTLIFSAEKSKPNLTSISSLKTQNSLNISKNSILDTNSPVLNSLKLQKQLTLNSKLLTLSSEKSSLINTNLNETENSLLISNTSSPILHYKRKSNVRLVSDLYDSDSNDSDSSQCPDEINFNENLNLLAATSTPKLDKLFTFNENINNSTKYYTLNSLSENTETETCPESIFTESSNVKCRSTLGIRKIKKAKMDHSTSSFKTCATPSYILKSSDDIFEQESYDTNSTN